MGKNVSSEDMPRERLLKLGAQALADRELLALLLRTGNREHGVLAFAEYILKERGGLLGLLNAKPEQLRRIKGLGDAKIAEILAVAELAKRLIQAEVFTREWCFDSSEAVRDFLLVHYKGLASEQAGALLLDGGNRLIKHIVLSRENSGKMVCFSLRLLLEEVLHEEASSVILVHNHPSGVAHSSSEDQKATRNIDSLLQAISVKLLDHFIVCGNHIVSMREEGVWKYEH